MLRNVGAVVAAIGFVLMCLEALQKTPVLLLVAVGFVLLCVGIAALAVDFERSEAHAGGTPERRNSW